MSQSKSLLDQIGLPQAVHLERLVLGAMQTDPEAPAIALGTLRAEDFHLEKHRRIFSAMKELRDNGENVDRITVMKELQRKGQLESVDGVGYLVGLDDGLPKLYHLDNYLGEIKEKAVLRKAAIRAYALVEECCGSGAGPETIQRAERFFRDLNAEAVDATGLVSLGGYLDTYPGGLEAFLQPQRAEKRVPTPWPGLNNCLAGGFRDGQLIIVAARPGLGKSAAAGQIAVSAARANYGTPVFSLEMDALEFWHRLIANVGQVSLQDWRRNRLSDVDRIQVQAGASELADLPLWIDDTSACTVSAIVAAVRRQRAKLKNVGIVIIDYVQLMTTGARRERRNEELAEISRTLKLAARELRVPIVVLAQLNRESVKENRKPQLHDLGDCGSFERDADIVMFLYQRPSDKVRSIQTGEPCPVQLIVAKQRQGPIGEIDCQFNARYIRLDESTRSGLDD